MDYKQKHQEDLEAAKGWLAIAKENNNKIAIQILEKFFPELFESEDEKIRKEIVEYLRLKYEDPNAIRHDYDKWIAWLEKKGENKSSWSEEDEEIINTIISDVTRIYRSCGIGTDEYNIRIKALNWLKSIKDRVQPQPTEGGEEFSE